MNQKIATVLGMVLFLLPGILMAQGAPTIHALIIADTNDRSIGASVKMDLEIMKERVKTYALESGMKLSLRTMEGDSVNYSQVTSAVQSMNPDSNDVVLYYFSGHGYRTGDKTTKWPMMNMKGNNLDLSWVIGVLRGKRARLKMAFSDSCNSYADRSLGLSSSPQVSRSKTYYKKLFLESQGEIFASGSSPGEYSWGGSSGGAFTLKFSQILDTYAKKSDVSWKAIQNQMLIPIGSGQTKQSPQFDISIKEVAADLDDILPGIPDEITSDTNGGIYSVKPSFQQVWSDSGSGADADFSVWQPIVGGGYSVFGQVGAGNYNTPSIGNIPTASGDTFVRAPSSYTLIWKDTGSGADKDAAVCQPNCPSGFVPLGSLFTEGYTRPTPRISLQACLNARYAKRSAPGGLIWNDSGSGAEVDLSVWTISGSPYLHAATGHQKPNVTLYAVDTDRLVEDLKVEYELSWKDTGSGAELDVSIWKPVSKGGGVVGGHIIGVRHAVPSIKYIKTIPASGTRAPDDYRMIWKDTGSGAENDVAIWEPICSGDYVALGMISTSNYNKPSRSASTAACVSLSLVKESRIDKQLWNDKGSGADQDVSFWAIKDSPYFIAVAGWSKPSRKVYILKD